MSSQGAYLVSYLGLVSLIVSSILLFSPKTETSRVVTIQKPLVITQERRTPAFYVYQQAQNLLQKPEFKKSDPSTFLSSLDVEKMEPKVQLTAMRLTRAEYARQQFKFDQPYQHNWSQPRQVGSIASNAEDSRVEERVVFSPPKLSLEQAFSKDEAQPLSPVRKWATIRGKLELTQGVGIVDHIIEIMRIEEGTVREIGRVDLTAGAYNIDIESPNGYLIAQIRDSAGLVIGVDRQRLVNLQNRGSYYEGPFIKVGRPPTLAANPALPSITKSSTTKSASAVANFATLKQNTQTDSTITATIFDNQKTMENIQDEYTNISSDSSSIVRISDASKIYADITTIRMTGETTETPVFTKKWIEGVVSYVSDLQRLQFRSPDLPVLLGRLMISGKEVAGAQISIDSLPSVQPLYFDQFMIPSLERTETSTNGYFIFVGLEPGVYDVVATIDGKPVSSQLFVAEMGRIAFQSITAETVPRAKLVKTFDAFLGGPVDSDLVIADQYDALTTIEGSLSYYSRVKNNVSEFLVRPVDAGYIPIRYVQAGQNEYAHIPLIQEKWLNDIIAAKLINLIPGRGTIIGFTKDLKFDAYLAGEDNSNVSVIYFDQYGQIIPQPALGGGFILFNVPAGAREAVLQDKETDKIYSQVFNVVAEQVSVSHF